VRERVVEFGRGMARMRECLAIAARLRHPLLGSTGSPAGEVRRTSLQTTGCDSVAWKAASSMRSRRG
jgi:hypothetical protein